MDRPDLDAWLDEADRVLDEDCYGRSWEADAMHVRAGEPVDPYEAMIERHAAAGRAAALPAAAWAAPEDDNGTTFPRQLYEQAFHDGGRPAMVILDDVISVDRAREHYATALMLHESGWVSEAARELALTGEVYTYHGPEGAHVVTRDQAEQAAEAILAGFRAIGEVLGEVGRQVVAEWCEMVQAMSPVLDAFTGTATETAAQQARVVRAAAPARTRTCPRHGDEMRAGQCRRCQREQVRRQRR